MKLTYKSVFVEKLTNLSEYVFLDADGKEIK